MTQVQGNDRNTGKNMQNNKYEICKNTYKKHDKAHHSSSKSILSRHISDSVYIQELYRNITIHVSSPPAISVLASTLVLPILMSRINLIDSDHQERILMHRWQMAHQCTSHNKC